MPTPYHGWRDCFPVVINTKTGKYDLTDAINTAIRQIFNELPDEDRKLFHQYTCHERRTDQHFEVMIRIGKMLKERKLV